MHPVCCDMIHIAYFYPDVMATTIIISCARWAESPHTAGFRLAPEPYKKIETVATQQGYRRGSGSRLFACKQIWLTPKSPRLSAPFYLFLYYQNAASLQILGEGGPPNSRGASL